MEAASSIDTMFSQFSNLVGNKVEVAYCWWHQTNANDSVLHHCFSINCLRLVEDELLLCKRSAIVIGVEPKTNTNPNNKTTGVSTLIKEHAGDALSKRKNTMHGMI